MFIKANEFKFILKRKYWGGSNVIHHWSGEL
jgi:hypothetical protein